MPTLLVVESRWEPEVVPCCYRMAGLRVSLPESRANEEEAMAVVAHVVLPGVTKAQYDQVREAVGWLDAPCLSHLTWWEGEDCHNMDAWESEEAFNTFGETRLGPGIAKAGVDAQPQVAFHPAHEVFTPQSVTITS